MGATCQSANRVVSVPITFKKYCEIQLNVEYEKLMAQTQSKNGNSSQNNCQKQSSEEKLMQKRDKQITFMQIKRNFHIKWKEDYELYIKTLQSVKNPRRRKNICLQQSTLQIQNDPKNGITINRVGKSEYQIELLKEIKAQEIQKEGDKENESELQLLQLPNQEFEYIDDTECDTISHRMKKTQKQISFSYLLKDSRQAQTLLSKRSYSITITNEDSDQPQLTHQI